MGVGLVFGELSKVLAERDMRRGQRLQENKDWAGAAAAYSSAIGRYADGPAEWDFRLGRMRERLKNWTGAVTAYEQAVNRCDDAPAEWHFHLGRTREHAGDWHGAATAYEDATSRRNDSPAWWHFRLGQTRERLKNWTGAVTAYEQAVNRRDDAPAEWHFRLGQMRERQKKWTKAKAAYRDGLDRDSSTTELDRRLLAHDVRKFLPRRRVTAFVAEHIGEIKDRAENVEKVVVDWSDRIYFYWAQGIDNAPPVVQLCHRQLTKNSSRLVMCLDDASIGEYADLPPNINVTSRTVRSDFLRLELLSRYGGTWLDATCLTLADIDEPLSRLREPSGFFAFTKQTTSFATWLLSSTPNHYIVAMLREALYAYWRNFGRNISYFTFHNIFETLVTLDNQFADIWNRTPHLPFEVPLKFRWNLTATHNEDRFNELLHGSFVNKLTYKYDAARITDESMLAHLLQNY